MKESTPMRVVAVDEDGVAQVRRLSFLEWLAFYQETKNFILAAERTNDSQIEAERAEFPALWDTDFRREAVRKFLGREK